MKSIQTIVDELNLTNSANDKLATLKSYVGTHDELFVKRILEMTYDKVKWTYNVSTKSIEKALIGVESVEVSLISFDEALIAIESLHYREVTGNAAIEHLTTLFSALSPIERDLIIKVLNRDLRINMGRSRINSIFKNLITKPVYNRCDIFSVDEMVDGKLVKGTSRNINLVGDVYMKIEGIDPADELTPEVQEALNELEPRAVVQLKADGTYREVGIVNSAANFISRSGEAYSYPALEKSLASSPDGYMTGELTVVLDDPLLEQILPKLIKADKKKGTDNVGKIKREYAEHQAAGKVYILPRSIGNGLINSDNVPFDNLIYEVWDFISTADYALAALKDKKNLPKEKYDLRFKNLIEIVALIGASNIEVIEHKFVRTLAEAVAFTIEKLNQGLEGSILKDLDELIFKDGTSKYQLKLKVAFEIEVRITGFIEGKPGTDRVKTFGSLVFETDDGLIKGSTSGFTDEMLKAINDDRPGTIGRIMTVEANDLTQGRNNLHHALSHPRYVEFRDDKDYTDDLERALDSLKSAKMFRKKVKDQKAK